MRKDMIVRRTVAHLRTEPNQRSELASQLIFGHAAEVVEQREKWIRCLCDDGMEGWIHRGYLSDDRAAIERYKSGDLSVVRAIVLRCQSEPSPGAETLVNLTDGSLISAGETEEEWTEVFLPDGRAGWVPAGTLVGSGELPEPNGESVVRLAKAYLGIPYLWGGTSTLALDCSGLSQLVYRLHGTVIPRNSFDQAEAGDEVDPGEYLNGLMPGDLLFLAEKERVDHVAVSMGGAEIIHASMSNGCVAFNSLDSDGDPYGMKLREMFRFARRFV